MLLTRIWMLLLAGAATFAVASILVAGNIVDRERDDSLNQVLVRDRSITDAALRHEARLRLDDIAGFAAHDEVKQTLRAASQRDPDNLKPLNTKLVTLLEELNTRLGEMDADLLFALDQRGVIVAQLGANRAQFGSSLETFPLVQAALSGRLRDDVWVYSGAVYRMAARPVILNGSYVGAIVHGKQIDAEFAQKLSKVLGGASLTFFLGQQVMASYVPVNVSDAPTQEQMLEVLPAALSDANLRKGNSSALMAIGNTGRGVFTWMTGPPKSLQVSYAIARPRQPLGEAFSLLSHASIKDTGTLPFGWIAGLFIVLAALGMVFVWFERDRAMRRFEHAAVRFANKQLPRLSPAEFSGAIRRIIEAINQGMDHAIEKKRGPRRKDNLDELLGSTTETTTGGGFFDFPKEQETTPRVPAKIDMGFAVPKVNVSTPGNRPKPPPPPPPATRGAVKATGIIGPAPARRKRISDAPTETRSVQEVAQITAALSKPMINEEEFAVISEVSAHFGSERSSAAPQAVIKGPSGASGAPSASNYEDLYREFMEIKRKCGEPTAGYSYEKFLVAVQKNREQIVKRHNAKDVRFSVYEKNGKAALKAKPIR